MRFGPGDYVVYEVLPERLWRVCSKNKQVLCIPQQEGYADLVIEAVCNLDGTPSKLPRRLKVVRRQLRNPNAMLLLALQEADKL